jgi:hypothetical protein
MHIRTFAFVLLAGFASSAIAQNLDAGQLGSLVKDRKWLIAMQGNLAHAGHAAHWDFYADGSMCPRFAGGKPDARCSDGAATPASKAPASKANR